jgi:REP element-mobilizing transposase RayT
MSTKRKRGFMVAGYHLIWTAYGWWLANDPRGSTSLEVRIESLASLGELHVGRKEVQPPPHVIREFYAEARDRLKHPLLTFEREDIDLIAGAFRKVIHEQGYVCYACAIMPDHVHILIRRHRHYAEDMIKLLQSTSRDAMIEQGRRASTHPVWTRGGGKMFQNTQADFVRTIDYIAENPLKISWPAQEWDFVQPYDGWLP